MIFPTPFVFGFGRIFHYHLIDQSLIISFGRKLGFSFDTYVALELELELEPKDETNDSFSRHWMWSKDAIVQSSRANQANE